MPASDAVIYEPQGARAWPESMPTAVLQVYDSRRQMARVGREQFYASGAFAPRHGLRGSQPRPEDPVGYAAVEGHVCCVFPVRSEPEPVGTAGTDDHRHGGCFLHLVEQLGRQDQQESVLRAPAQS